MDFMADRLSNGKTFRILTIVDQYSRECPVLEVDGSLTGQRVVESLERLAWLRGKPETITVDNGSEFCSRAMDDWAYRNGVKLDFIRPGKPVENGFIESFNGRLRDQGEFLGVDNPLEWRFLMAAGGQSAADDSV